MVLVSSLMKSSKQISCTNLKQIRIIPHVMISILKKILSLMLVKILKN